MSTSTVTTMADSGNATPPGRSTSQRAAALAKANDVRIYRAELKRDIAAGQSPRTVRDIIAEPREYEATWKLHKLLVITRGVGPVKASRLLRASDIPPSKTIGGLTARQRHLLLQFLPCEPERD